MIKNRYINGKTFYKKFMRHSNISEIIRYNSKKFKDKFALIFNKEKITFYELNNKVNLLAGFLQKLRAKKILTVLPNCPELVYIFLSTAKLGSVIVPLSLALNIRDIKNQIIDLDIDVVICRKSTFLELKKVFKNSYKKINFILYEGDKRHESLDNILNQKKIIKISRKNIKKLNSSKFMISPTSGSTGKPKKVIFLQKTKLKRFLAAKKLYKLKTTDIFISCFPLDHSLGQRNLFLPLLLGSTTILLANFTYFNWFKSINKYKVSFSFLIGNQVNHLIENHYKKIKSLKYLKQIVSASSNLKIETKKKLAKIQNILSFEMYGASEISTVSIIDIKKNRKHISSVGKRCSESQIEILKDNKIISKSGLQGEIICKTSQIFDGYLNKKENKDCFYKKYFKTGDIGYFKNNYLYFTGRNKNIIKISGINIYPEQIEKEIISKLKTIEECCVISKPDIITGEKILLYYKKKSKIKKKQDNLIRLFCKNNFSLYEQPVDFIEIEKFPKTQLGKIDRKKIK